MSIVSGLGSAADGFDAALTPEAYQAAWRYAWHLRPVYEDAQDLLQESLAHAFLRFHQLRDARRFKVWLLRVVRTRFLMSRRVRRLPASDDEPAHHTALETQLQVDGHYAGLPPTLVAGILRLPCGQREVLDLHYLQELSVDEVAGVLGVRPGTVKVRLHRARNRLKRAMGAAAKGRLSRAERGD